MTAPAVADRGYHERKLCCANCQHGAKSLSYPRLYCCKRDEYVSPHESCTRFSERDAAK